VNLAVKYIEHGKTKHKFLRALVDTGCSKSLIYESALPTQLPNSLRKPTRKTVWHTNAGTFHTDEEIHLSFKLPEFQSSTEVDYTFTIDAHTSNPRYDAIIGRDLQKALKMIINWDSHHIIWENHAVHMVPCIVDMDDPTGEKARALLQEILNMSSEPETVQDMQA